MLSDSKLEVTSLDFNKFSFYTDKSHTGHTFIFLWSVSLHTSPRASPESLDLYHTPQLSFLAPTGVTIPETPTDFGEGNQTCWRGPGEVIREWKSKTCFFSAHWTCNTWLSGQGRAGKELPEPSHALAATLDMRGRWHAFRSQEFCPSMLAVVCDSSHRLCAYFLQ